MTPGRGLRALAGALVVSVTLAAADAGAQAIGAPAPIKRAPEASTDLDPQVATDGRGSWVAVWSSTDKLGGTLGGGTDTEILFAESADGGASWTAPRAVNDDFDVDRDDFLPQVASDGTRWTAAWASTANQGGRRLDVRTATRVDGRLAWGAQQTVSCRPPAGTPFSEDFAPHLATDGRTWVLVWESRNKCSDPDQAGQTDIDVLWSQWDGREETPWSAPQPLAAGMRTDGGRDDTDPRIDTDGRGNWMVVWTTGAGENADIAYAVGASGAGGALTWQAPDLVDRAGVRPRQTDGFPQVASDAAGRWLVVWQSRNEEHQFPDYDILFSQYDGQDWTPRAAVDENAAGDELSDAVPQVASDGLGRWVVAWLVGPRTSVTVDRGGQIKLATALAAPALRWSRPVVVSSTAVNVATGKGREPALQIASDGAAEGSWVLVWEGSTPAGPEILTAAATSCAAVAACDDANACTEDRCEALCLYRVAELGTDCSSDACTTRQCAAGGVCRTVSTTDCPDPTPNDCAAFRCNATTGACEAFDPCPCGNGVLDGDEECEPAQGPCCNPDTCRLRGQDTACRPPAGPCDREERCDGVNPVCPVDEKLQATLCRDVGDLVCDRAETCDGVQNDCPADQAAPQGAVCVKDPENECESGFCDGSQRTCQSVEQQCGFEVPPRVETNKAPRAVKVTCLGRPGDTCEAQAELESRAGETTGEPVVIATLAKPRRIKGSRSRPGLKRTVLRLRLTDQGRSRFAELRPGASLRITVRATIQGQEGRRRVRRLLELFRRG